MKLYKTDVGPVIQKGERFYHVAGASWDSLAGRGDILSYLTAEINAGRVGEIKQLGRVQAPIQSQEVWAAGVTYWRSKEARMEESKSAGGGEFYDRVYSAVRPELFFKATPHRVAGPGETVRIRKDSRWNVPEPELTLLIASTGAITGYTIGNDMSSRDIEGENPLYLPQAKVYDGCCGLGPCVYLTDQPLAGETKIAIQIRRGGAVVFEGATAVSRIKRELASLAEFLFRESSFPAGCFLLTGTGVVPPDGFTLASGDEIAITIEPMGTLVNGVQ